MPLPQASRMKALTYFTPAARRQRVNTSVKSYVNRRISANKEIQEVTQTTAAANAAYDAINLVELSGLAATATPQTKHETVRIRGKIQIANPASAGSVFVRIVMFQWYADNNVEVPNYADIFGSAAAATSVLSWLEPDTFDNRVKGKLISDRVYRLGEAASVEGQEQRIIPFNITQKQLGRKYVLGTGSAKGFNKVYIMAVSNIADASSPPTLACLSQEFYKSESD